MGRSRGLALGAVCDMAPALHATRPRAGNHQVGSSQEQVHGSLCKTELFLGASRPCLKWGSWNISACNPRELNPLPTQELEHL